MFSSYWLSNDYFSDIVELVPILVLLIYITIQGLEFRTSRYCNIQSLSSKERLDIEKIVVVLINNVREQLIG
jgi:hypothetical protein